MNKTKINEIIRKKIDELKDTPQMKVFLLDILEHETSNIDQSRTIYTKDYRDWIRTEVNHEGGE